MRQGVLWDREPGCGTRKQVVGASVSKEQVRWGLSRIDRWGNREMKNSIY
jgi:hypothetical protein